MLFILYVLRQLGRISVALFHVLFIGPHGLKKVSLFHQSTLHYTDTGACPYKISLLQVNVDSSRCAIYIYSE